MTTDTSKETWAIVNLMGHRQRAGRICPVDQFGVQMMRIDIPIDDGFVTEFYGGSSLYGYSLVEEEVARAVCARQPDPRPVSPAGFRPAIAHHRDQEADDEVF